MLTLAAQVLFLVTLVRASEFLLQPRSGPCDSSGPDYVERVCGDICLPVGQFCCGNVPASSLLYACAIGTVCANGFINDSDYTVACCEGLYNPPTGALASCQTVSPFPSTSYNPGTTATAPITAPSSTACGAEVNAEGYGYRDCGDICLDVEHICCGFIPGTNQAWSCGVGQTCLYSGSANIAPGNCVYASGYIVPGTIFVASNTTVASSPPSSTATSAISSSSSTTTSTISSSSATTTSTISSSSATTTSTISSSTPSTTSSSGLTTSSTGSSTITSESASITSQSSSSSTTSELPISTTSTVAVGSGSSLGTVTSSPSQPAFTGAATRHSPIENGVIYALGGLIVGAAGDLGLF